MNNQQVKQLLSALEKDNAELFHSFDPLKEEWKHYINRFENYIKLKEMNLKPKAMHLITIKFNGANSLQSDRG